MGFQSIFARKALPEAGFAKKAVIDAYRSFHEGFASGWLHRNVRPILPQASRVWNLQRPLIRTRASVRRASGFVRILITLIHDINLQNLFRLQRFSGRLSSDRG